MIGTIANTVAIVTGSVIGSVVKRGIREEYQGALFNAMGLASTYGIGIALAGAVLFLWQGAIYLGASALSGFLSEALLAELSIVGGVLIAASGLSILNIQDCRTMNMLPSLLVPVVWFLIVL